jgi:hypothetical protein
MSTVTRSRQVSAADGAGPPGTLARRANWVLPSKPACACHPADGAPEPIPTANWISALVESLASPAVECERCTQSSGCMTWRGSNSAGCANSRRAGRGDALVKSTSPRIRSRGRLTCTSTTCCSCCATGAGAIWSRTRVPGTEGRGSELAHRRPYSAVCFAVEACRRYPPRPARSGRPSPKGADKHPGVRNTWTDQFTDSGPGLRSLHPRCQRRTPI